MNYVTDALAGAALGATTGWALPWLLHRPEAAPPSAVRLVPSPGGLALVF
jgi:membrane-associated phospholipid phosphatase